MRIDGARVRALVPPLAGVAAVAALALSQPALHAPTGGVLDLWPLYYGARAWLETGDAYWIDPTLPDVGPLGEVSNAYPLHAALTFGMAMAPFPMPQAAVVWVLVVGFAWIGAIAWARESWMWLLWFPMWDALRMQQPSAAVTVSAIIALGALRRGNRTAFLIAVPLMMIKPHLMTILALAMMWWGRRWWREMLLVWSVALLLTFLAQPDWVARWIDRIQAWSAFNRGEVWLGLALIPLGLVMHVKGWRPSGLAVLSTGLGNWTISGNYIPSTWPLGMTRTQHVASTFLWMAGLALALVTGWYWAFPAVLIGGLMVVALAGVADARPGPPAATSPVRGPS